MKDYSNYHPSFYDKVLNDGNILFDLHKDSLEGHSEFVDNVATKLIIVDKYNNPEGDLKKITGDIGSFKVGSIVTHQSNNWIVIEVTRDNPIYQNGTIQLANNSFKFFSTSTSTLIDIPCIITDKILLDEDENKYLTSVNNQVYMIVRNDAINQQINVNEVFKIGLSNYEVLTICDDISKPGLLIFKLKFSEIEQVLPLFTIEILNGGVQTTDTSTPIQLNYQIKDHDTILVSPPQIIFTSSDELVATVNSTGTVTPVSIGNVNIMVSLESDSSVNDSIIITVEEIPVAETYYLELTGSVQLDSEIKQGQTTTYTCIKKNSSGVVVSGQFDFTVNLGITPSSAYTFTILSDTQCSIKCNSSVYYIDLIATDRLDNTLSISKHIKLRALF